MKRFYLFCILLFNTFYNFADCRNDSTVICYQYLNSSAIGIAHTITISTFHTDSGIVENCVSESVQNGPFSPYTCTSAYYSADTIIYNAQGLVSEVLRRTGSPGGWVNNSDVQYTYDIDSNLLEEVHLSWNGLAWDSVSKRVKNYLPGGFITEDYTMLASGGVLYNSTRFSCNYSGSQLTDKIFQHGNGSSWLNDSQFVYIYTAGNLRDSLVINYWDTATNNWLFRGKFQYVLNEAATVIWNDTLTVFGIPTMDTLRYVIDTLDQILLFTTLRPISIDTSIDEMHADRVLYEYIYYNGAKLVTRAFSSDVYIDLIGVWGESADCNQFNQYFTYDSVGHLIEIYDVTRCGMPREGVHSFTYDPYGYLFQDIITNWSNVSDYYLGKTYYHADSSYIMVSGPPWNSNLHYCQGNTFQYMVNAIGGCPPYHYSWSPQIGLSSDTVADPFITIGDSTYYTVLISDDYGHFATFNYNVFPDFSIFIRADTTDPNFTGILSTEQNSNYLYQWYFNNAIISGANNYTYYATLPGSYYVNVFNPLMQCTATSDSVYLNAHSVFVNTIPTQDLFLRISPNPVNDKLTVTTGFVSLQIPFFIYDLYGRKCFSGMLSPGINFVLVEELPSGIYQLVCSSKRVSFIKLER